MERKDSKRVKLVVEPEKTSDLSEKDDYTEEDFVEAEELEEYQTELWGGEEEEELPDYFYNTQEFLSSPYLGANSSLSRDVVEFDYSYGYDCQRLFNLCLVDEEVLAFASGNLIHFFDTTSGKKWFRRSFSGSGIGHLTKNPKQSHIAVGEKGDNPLIVIYEWPSFHLVTVLKGGTKTGFTCLDYSPDGELLCSQGNSPDYALTIWDWRKKKIVLRTKSCSQTVFNLRFSLFTPGLLTSSGIGHIKFWKISRTFTGLKLLGESGRFGKSEICNVIGFLALPDEKVVSGCEWGNILVWDEGLIRVEVCRVGRRPCHDAPITQFMYDNGELTTVAMDGSVKVWHYESVELADPPEEDKFVELEPIFEYKIGDYYHRAKLMVVSKTEDDDLKEPFWYGQDASGGIWKLDLSKSTKAESPTMILQCHAGAVAAVQCSPFSTHMATLGEDGKLYIHDYDQRQTILKKEFLPGGRSMLWLPLGAEDSGCVIIGGFTDGVIRVVCVSIIEYNLKMPSPTGEYINLIQVSKPHTKAVTVITVNPRRNIIVTGSDDATIFIYRIKRTVQFGMLVPVGFMPVPGEVSHCAWKPRREATILVSCKNGSFIELELPLKNPVEDPTSYLLEYVNSREQKFMSVKSEILRNLKTEEILAQRKVLIEEKREELLLKREGKSLTEDDELALDMFREQLAAEELDIPELYIPKIPSPILFATYIGETIWLSMGGYDAGYLYEYDFQNGLIQCKLIPDATDVEIACYHYYYDDKYLVLGMQDGKIRVVKVNPADRIDLSDYLSLSMHDNDTGVVRQICFDFNYSHMFTCGSDGNIFSYEFHPEKNDYKNVKVEPEVKGFPSKVYPDIDDPSALSLEQTKNAIERDEKFKEADAYKKNLIDILKDLEKKYEAVMRRNSRLPASQQLTPDELILDERIVEDREKYLEEKKRLARFKIAWHCEKTKLLHDKVSSYFLRPVETYALRLFAINKKKTFIKTFRLQSLGNKFEEAKNYILEQLGELQIRERALTIKSTDEEEVVKVENGFVENPVEEMEKQIADLRIDPRRCTKLRRLLKKYGERKERMRLRKLEWDAMMRSKPSVEDLDPRDVADIAVAKATIGDCRLKTDPDYSDVSEKSRVTSVRVYEELINTKEKIYLIRKGYNDEVIRLRQQKQDLIEKHERLREVLLDIEKEIPKDNIRNPPNLPVMVKNVEFPEKKFTIDETGALKEMSKKVKTVFKLEENARKKEVKRLDPEYEMFILDKKGQKPKKFLSKLTMIKRWGITGSRNFEELQEAGMDDDTATPWEKELKYLRVQRRLQEQDEIIDELEADAKNFDEAITKMKESKYQVEVDLQFLKLHLLILHQEVLVLKEFEAAEEEKLGELSEKEKQTQAIRDKMNETDAKIEVSRKTIRTCREEMKNLILTFHEAASKSPFYYLLKEIFNKKYKKIVDKKIKKEKSEVLSSEMDLGSGKKPEEDEEEEEEDSSSEESSSEDSSSSSSTSLIDEQGKDNEAGDDARSLDSKQIDPFLWDENVCPPGCEPELHEWTLSMRNTRHGLQLNKKDEKKRIDQLEKEYEMLADKITPLESQKLKCKNELVSLAREKHGSIQELETVVVLRPDQIQSFRSESEMENVSDSVLFSASGLTRLYKRVGELERETQAAREKHERNLQHFARMKIDVEHMKNTKTNLLRDLDETTIKKFGTKVDIDEIEEVLLERLVAEMHGAVMDVEKEQEKKLASVRQQLIQKENEYARRVQDNTYRYNILTALQEEKMRIQDIIKRQDSIEEAKMNKIVDEDDEGDLQRLRALVQEQEIKITEMRRELGAIKLKCEYTPVDIKENFLRVRKGMGDCEVEVEEEAVVEPVCDVEEERRRMTEQMETLIAKSESKIPEEIKVEVIRRLSKGVIKEELMSRHCAEGVILEIVRNIKTESYLDATEIAKEIIEAVLPKLED